MKSFSIQLPDDDNEWLEKLAKDNDRSKTAQIRVIVKDARKAEK